MNLNHVTLVFVAAALCGTGCGGSAITSDPVPQTATTVAAARSSGAIVFPQPRRWKVGDVVTTETKGMSAWHLRTERREGKPLSLGDWENSFVASWIEGATDVDEAGGRTRYVVYVREWSRTSDRGEDASLRGAFLTVSGDGVERTWAFSGEHRDPTPEARGWLDEHFGAHGLSDEQWYRILRPDRAVAPGESWRPNAEQFGDAATRSGLLIDRATVTATAALQAIEDAAARCSFNATVALLRVPTSQAPWITGGILRSEGTMAVSLDPSGPILSLVRRRTLLDGEASEHDETVRYEFIAEEQRTATLGGPFPEPRP